MDLQLWDQKIEAEKMNRISIVPKSFAQTMAK
jgi:hypothetical protein